MRTSLAGRADNLQLTVNQLERIAETKRTKGYRDDGERTISMQEVQQLEEAIRLLRWIRE